MEGETLKDIVFDEADYPASFIAKTRHLEPKSREIRRSFESARRSTNSTGAGS